MNILSIFAIFLLFLTGCSNAVDSKTVRPPSLALLAPGAVQPLQRLTDIHGQTIRLDQPEQRKLLIFFATWCSDSQRAIRQIQASALSATAGFTNCWHRPGRNGRQSEQICRGLSAEFSIGGRSGLAAVSTIYQ